MHRASSYSMYTNQQDAQNSLIRLYLYQMIYTFRTILVPLQEQLLQSVHRIWYMSAYAGTICDVQLIKSCS